MSYLYLLINIASVIVPLIFSFHPKIQFYKQWRYFFPALAIALLIFIPWDVYFTHIGVWGFNARYLIGLTVFNLPIEEVLFFICIPYACVFTYHCLYILIKKNYFLQFENTISIILVLLLLVVSIFNVNQLYTSVTFGALSLFIIFLKYVLHVKWLHRFYFAYLFLMIPFFTVNGILTGSGIDEPVVWYNNAQNLNIRILTIPFEDVFYGMLLLLLTISVYEYLIKKNKPQQ